MATWTSKVDFVDKILAADFNALQTLKADIQKKTAANMGVLDEGELGLETDTKDVYIGAAGGNELISDHSARDFLNGQDQAVKTTSGPTFAGLTLSAINLTLPGGDKTNFFLCGSGAGQVGNMTCTGTGNVALGSLSGLSLTTATQNVLIGHASGTDLTTGYGNILIGPTAGYHLISGDVNVLIGKDAGAALTTQSGHTCVGYEAGLHSSGVGGPFPGGPNDFFGSCAGRSNTEGYFNVFIGANAGWTNTTGFENTFVGNCAGMLSLSGHDNTIMGQYAGGALTTGVCNTFIGQQAGGYLYETGGITFEGFRTGNFNTFLGCATGQKGDGSSNVFIGYQCGFYETGSATFMLDNILRANEADARIKCLAYGIFAAASANQRLRINGRFGVTEVPIYANNAAAVAGGLAVGEFYRTNADPDPVCIVH